MNSLDAPGPDGLILRVEFIRLADRYRHVVSVVEPGGQVHPVFESVEGTATDDWPASPPLQSLSIEELTPARRAALLVGMAGNSHWSASIEPVSGHAALVFDIACRAAGECGPLGSQYRRVARLEVKITAEDGVLSDGDNQTCIKIAPAASAATKSRTVRWKYRIELG
ncbi:MAG: hypothetical protein L0211_22785 [Planctomycetaceae bacterium]|nr:hypothetical protein [Planctomycetaceae bacterium]